MDIALRYRREVLVARFNNRFNNGANRLNFFPDWLKDERRGSAATVVLA
jgi:hypothetical protein